MALELNEKNFQSEVIDYKGSVFVDFWAPWCGPCRMMGPIVDGLVKVYEGKNVKIAKVNIDENPELARKYNVSSIPTLGFFKNGEIVHQEMGVKPQAELEAIIEKHLL